MIAQEKINVRTKGRETINISQEVNDIVSSSGVSVGLCHVFLHHTSASLILCENADPTVRSDLNRFMERLVQDGDPIFDHTDEGPDDMSAHVRTVITHSDITIPFTDGRCTLGTWQGIYLWEHRKHGHHRELTITVSGD